MDAARKWTDKRLLQMEAHLRQIFAQSKKELTEKWNAYMKSGKERLDALYYAYTVAPADKKAEMLKKYQDALKNFTFKSEWYRDMVNQTTHRIAHVNEIAVSYINGQMPAIYVRNFNEIDPDALLIKANWTLRNENMLKNLAIDSLPNKKVNVEKDTRWNSKQINSSVLQGVIQGESIDKIAKRLLPIVGNNEKAAIRTARTMVTGAENRGRLDRYRDYSDEGCIVYKIWLATPDGRTRDWHLDMDGQEVPWDDYFIDGLGNELEYPGDTGAPPETVFNCRCTMKSHITGVRNSDGTITHIREFEKVGTLHNAQIAAERERREEARERKRGESDA